MKITLLGTGSPLPDPRRAGPATLVQVDGLNLLIDAGRGVTMRLAGAGVLPVMLDAVLLTHFHSDHICDLNDVITTHWVMAAESKPLAVYGPPGTKGLIDAMLGFLVHDVQYRLDHHADLNWRPNVVVHEVAPGDQFAIGSATIRVGATVHRPVEPTIAYRVEAPTGQSVVLAGDGIPCDTLDELCAGATAYVQSVIRDDLVRLVPNGRLQDILDYHSSVEQAAHTATRANVGTLVLTHYVPSMQPGQEEDWRAIAAAHFAGPIVLGDDLTSLEV